MWQFVEYANTVESDPESDKVALSMCEWVILFVCVSSAVLLSLWSHSLDSSLTTKSASRSVRVCKKLCPNYVLPDLCLFMSVLQYISLTEAAVVYNKKTFYNIFLITKMSQSNWCLMTLTHWKSVLSLPSHDSNPPPLPAPTPRKKKCCI